MREGTERARCFGLGEAPPEAAPPEATPPWVRGCPGEATEILRAAPEAESPGWSGRADECGRALGLLCDPRKSLVLRPSSWFLPSLGKMAPQGLLSEGWGCQAARCAGLWGWGGGSSPALSLGQGAEGGMGKGKGKGQTLNTNISPRSMATVSKSPSQMLGPYWSGRSVGRGCTGGPAFGGHSGFPPGGGGWGGLGGRWSGRPGRRAVTVGRGRVGCG